MNTDKAKQDKKAVKDGEKQDKEMNAHDEKPAPQVVGG
jgi:hypothetical protein